MRVAAPDRPQVSLRKSSIGRGWQQEGVSLMSDRWIGGFVADVESIGNGISAQGLFKPYSMRGPEGGLAEAARTVIASVK